MKNVYFAALNSVPFLPYVAGLLRAYVEEDPETAREYRFAEAFFLPESPTRLVERITDPAILGLSCYVWNFRRQMKLARLCKQKYPDALVIAGGPHIPNKVGGFLDLHPYVDILVHGEGESAFYNILKENLAPHPDWSRILGISYRRGGLTLTTGPAETLPRMIQLRSPYLEGYLNDSIALCRARGLRFYALWETNRGCPYSCSFCDWGSATMSKVRRFNDERLQQEIEFFGRAAIPNIFICDANFGILPRDLDLAEHLANTREQCGFPRQVRVNFAKNSNDRVFAISKSWADNDMLMGTTLSLQSTSMEVLEAVDRKNIGTERYRDLKRRYTEAGIHTYTELILGLPRESRTSFKEGLCELLEAGNHEDIRVYELTILPNAPMNNEMTLGRYSIQTTEKQIYGTASGTPDDEIEYIPVVFETNTLSRDDWIDCALFAQAIQFLHNGCYTRYISIHLNRQYNLKFIDFYTTLQRYFLERATETVLGSILSDIRSMYRRYQRDPRLPQVTLIASQPKLLKRLNVYGKRRGWTVDDYGWLSIASQQDAFYDEVREFIVSLSLGLGPEIDDVLRYQKDIMLRLDYDPHRGKVRQYAYNFPAYFQDDILRDTPTSVHFKDTHMGVNRQYPLVRNNPTKFAKAAIGESYPFVRVRHYQHQIDVAEIQHECGKADVFH